MRVVLLTAHTPEGEAQHRYVAGEVARRFGDNLHSIIVATGVPKSRTQKLRAWFRRYNIRQLTSRVAVRVIDRMTKQGAQRQRSFQSVLFPEGDSGLMPAREKLVLVRSHNGTECLNLVRQANPDIVLVYGTLIIGKRLIGSARRIINLHTGLSPRYRGSDTIFWPIFNQEPEHIGVTIHRLEAGIDSGPILARGRPTISPSADEAVVFAKSVALGADLLCRSAIREVEGLSQPIAQDLAQGREYRSVERTLASERRVKRLLKSGIFGKGLDQWQEEY